jgi:hypothetical protein
MNAQSITRLIFLLFIIVLSVKFIILNKKQENFTSTDFHEIATKPSNITAKGLVAQAPNSIKSKTLGTY